ncbi:MAG: LamG-like jellyroll fold domain-containing protein, partial [Sulfuricurvum sp.]
MQKHIFLFFLLTVSILDLFGATRYVSGGTKCAGNSYTYYSTIQAGITASSSGDTVSICDGTYNENNIQITKNNLTIQSYSGNRENVTVGKNNNSVFIIQAANATIKNLSIASTGNSSYGITDNYQGSGSHTFDNLSISTKIDSIYLGQNSSSNSFSNLILSSSSGRGIALAYNASGNPTFSNISIASSGSGIDIARSSALSFTDVNVTSTSGSGILLTTNSTGSNTFSNVSISSYGDGITSPGSGTQTFSGVTITSSNGAGIVASGISSLSDFSITAKTYGINNTFTQDATIEKGTITTTNNNGINLSWGSAHALSISNTVISAGGIGIYIPVASSATINKVCITASTYGIYTEWNAYNVTIKNSKFSNNTNYGVYIVSSSSYPATVTNNCFQTSPFAYRNNSAHTFTGNYWNGTAPSGYDSSPLSSCPVTSCYTSTPSPIADYRMDECSWSGVSGEVMDSSTNLINGTALNSLTTLDEGILGRMTTFNGSNQYISAPGIASYLQTTASLSFWIKTAQTGNNTMWMAPGVTGVESSGNGNDVFWGWIDASGRIGIMKGDTAGAKSTNPINDGTWKHVVLTRDSSSGKVQVYINGVLNNEATSATGDVTTSFASIGRIEDTAGSPEYFNGSLDEVKIYSSVLSAAQIAMIYQNEASGLNYDGISRTAVCCCVPSGGNLIANPSFETLCNSNIIATFNNVAGGTARSRSGLCGWEVAYGIETWENTTSPAASDGSVFVELDGASNHIDKIWQTLDTTEDRTYIIQFDYRKRSTSYKEGIIAKWNGVEIASVDGLTTKWQTAQIEVVGTSGLDTLTFEEPAASDDSIGSWIDNIRVIGGAFTTQKRYSFDAWDSFRTISDRNISTKIVNNPFTLSVASLNTTNTALQDFNGTVCVQILDTISGNQLGDRSCRVWNPLQSTTYTFTSLSATKNAAAKIAWKKSDLSGTFTVGSEDNATLSSDRFAIRPAAFAINAPNATAGKDFNITFTAPIFGTSTASNGYNETAGISFDVSVAEHKPACPMGTFSPALSSFSFLNGSKILTTRYNEVGVLDINISDRSKPCGSMYASVDCDDPDVSSYYTQASDLPIGDTSGQITIIPDRFDVNATLSNFDGKEFTYLSDDLNMSAQLDLVITAKNAEGNTTKNYTSECYSKNTTLTLPHSEVPDPLTKILYSEALSAVNTSVL